MQAEIDESFDDVDAAADILTRFGLTPDTEPDEREIAQSAIDLAMETYSDNIHDATKILVHYGVLGMHWGIRKNRNNRSARTSRSTARSSARLSDDDLQATINRMRLEKQYDEIANPPSSTRVFITKHGDKVAGAAISTVATFAVRRALDRRFGAGSGRAVTEASRAIKLHTGSFY